MGQEPYVQTGVVAAQPVQAQPIGVQPVMCGVPAPVTQDVAQNFLRALRQEYVYMQQNAVGEVVDCLPPEQSNVLLPFEDEVRDSADRAATINSIMSRWGVYV